MNGCPRRSNEIRPAQLWLGCVLRAWNDQKLFISFQVPTASASSTSFTHVDNEGNEPCQKYTAQTNEDSYTHNFILQMN